MKRTFTREELYAHVWSEPMRTLAKHLGISDVALAKACRRANVPRPPRGHWARLRAGRQVARPSLPPRGPGMSESVTVGGGYWERHASLSDKEILASEPQQPVFTEELEEIATQTRLDVGRVIVSNDLENAHPLIRQLLAEDEVRRHEMEGKTYVSRWDEPRFEGAFEQRRLRILDAIFAALTRYGMKPSVKGRYARELNVKINDTHVSFTLDEPGKSGDDEPWYRSEPPAANAKLELKISSYGAPAEPDLVWQDEGRKKVESRLGTFVTELIVSAERQYRRSRERHHEWLLERKAHIRERLRVQKEQAEREARERQERLEREKIERLLADAASFRSAQKIRDYVDQVTRTVSEQSDLAPTGEVERWRVWALAQADRIDPVRSSRYLDSINEPA